MTACSAASGPMAKMGTVLASFHSPLTCANRWVRSMGCQENVTDRSTPCWVRAGRPFWGATIAP